MSAIKDDTRATLFDRVITDFAAAYPAVEIEIENQKFEQPGEAPFISLYMRIYESYPASINASRQFIRHWGYLCVDVLVPEDTGTKTMYEMADVIERNLGQLDLSLPDRGRVLTKVPKTTPPAKSQGFYFITVMVPFIIDGCYDV